MAKTRKKKRLLNMSDYDTTYHQFITKQMPTSDLSLRLALKDETSKERKSVPLPKDDFYTSVNHLWIKETQDADMLKGKYYTKYDEYTVTQDKVYSEILGIAEKYMHSNKQLKNVYNSAMFRTKSHDVYFDKNVTNVIGAIDGFIEEDDLYGLLAYINKYEIVSGICPLLWKALPDLKDPKTYRNNIQTPNTPVNTSFYTEKTPYGTKVIKKLEETIDVLFKVFNKIDKNKKQQIPNVGKTVVDITRQIVETIQKEAPLQFYNIVGKRDAVKKYNFDWEQFSKKLGYAYVPDVFITDNPIYIKNIMTMMKENWKTPEWRSYWIYMFARQLVRMHSKHIQIYFNFYRKFLAGADARLSNIVFTCATLSQTFNKLISTEYVKQYTITENLEFVKNFSQDLKQVFINILQKNTWLSPTTKREALFKLEKLKMIMGNNMDAFLDDPIIEYSPVDLWGNLEKIFAWRASQFISLCDKTNIKQIDFPGVNWNVLQLVGRQPYIVNAFYTPSKNDIYIPIAYMQKPFLDLHSYGIEYCVAHMGTTLCHELSHSLDNNGSNYNYKGQLKNWWLPKDSAKFNAKIDNIVAQYDSEHAKDRIQYDSRISIGENMADICAVYICENYLVNFQTQYSSSVPNKFLMMTGFYTYFAIQMRQVLHQRSMRNELISNPHSLDKYRVNIPLSRLPLFQTIYNIKPGDGMYWKNTEPIW